MKNIVVLFLVVLGCAGAAIAQTPYYTTVLNPPSGSPSYPGCWAQGVATVNGAPEAVGTFATTSSGKYVWGPAAWSSNGTATSLLPLIPGATAAQGALEGRNCANAVDSDGDIVGEANVGGGRWPSTFPAAAAWEQSCPCSTRVPLGFRDGRQQFRAGCGLLDRDRWKPARLRLVTDRRDGQPGHPRPSQQCHRR